MNTSPGAILLLLLAVYLLLAFFTGRLEWLFAMGRDVTAGYHATPAAPAAQGPTPPSSTGYPPRVPAYA